MSAELPSSAKKSDRSENMMAPGEEKDGGNQYYDSQDMGDEDEGGGLSPINLPTEDLQDDDDELA